MPPWDTELLVLAGADRGDLLQRVERLGKFVASTAAATARGMQPAFTLADLAFTLATSLGDRPARVALVARDLAELQQRLERAAERLRDASCRQIKDVVGIYYFDEPLYAPGRLAALFPGEGAQYLGMMGDLLPHFPEMRQMVEMCDQLAHEKSGAPPLSRFLRPPGNLTADQRGAADRELRELENAMYSVMLCDQAMAALLRELQLPIDAVAGHSAGELAALGVAGVYELDDMPLVEMTRSMVATHDGGAGHEGDYMLLAVGASREKLTALVSEAIAAELGDRLRPEWLVAMDNCPHQTVLVGPAAELTVIERHLERQRLMCERLMLDRPYHTRWFEPLMGTFSDLFQQVPFRLPKMTVYSATTTKPFPDDADAIRELALAQWASPVEFTRTIRSMHDEGIRLFVEVGPRGNLTTFVEDILRGRPILAVASNVQRRSGTTQLNHLVGQLTAHGVPLRLEHLLASRRPKLVAWDDAEAAAHQHPRPHGASSSARAALMSQHLQLMDQLLADQQQVMQSWLARRGRRLSHASSGERATPAVLPSQAPPAAPLPLVGELIHCEPGRRVVVRRKLDPAEDLYGGQHTVGGRSISHVDPDQHGLPVGPMTFTLEMMAEVASLLLPGMVVLGHENVQLMRWLALDEDDPSTVEVSARRLDEPRAGRIASATERVLVEVRDLGGAKLPLGGGKGAMAAIGTVALAAAWPAVPAAEPLALTNEHASPVSSDGAEIDLDVLYRNLFHGERFQGVRRLGRSGTEGIEADVEVLPRHGLFRSNDDPQFLLDPVLMDVIMHPACAWHLEQPDQAGRIMLPFELECFEVFGPRPAPGTRFLARARMVLETPRQITHEFEAVDGAGRLWCRFTGAKSWRFYVPFCGVNFHGPKDEYFLSLSWPAAEPTGAGMTDVGNEPRPPIAEARDEQAACSVAWLDPPGDLLQSAMQKVTARVGFSPECQQQWKALDLPERARGLWLFDQMAAKDAVRMLYWKRHGRRIFAADLVVELDEQGRCQVQPRRGLRVGELPAVVLARGNGPRVALAAYNQRLGIAIAPLAGDDVEATRQAVARRAVAQALGCPSLAETAGLLEVQTPAAGGQDVGVHVSPRASEASELAGSTLRVRVVEHEKHLVASTLCEVLEP